MVRDSEALLMSVVVLGELLFGFRGRARFEDNVRELKVFLVLPAVRVVPTSETTADRYARIAASLRRRGTPIPTNDIWIAAHAFETGSELVTLDEHFEQGEGLPLLLAT